MGSSRKMRSGSFTSARASTSRRFMPPESAWMRLSARVSSVANSSSRGMRASHSPRAQAEVAAVHLQVLAHREVGIEVVHLRDDAHADAPLARGLRHRDGRAASISPASGCVSPSSMRSVVVLPAPLGPSRP